MPSFNAQQINATALSGNNVVILFGDVPIAFGQAADNAVDLGAEQLYGIGTAKPQEIQQFKYSPSITLSQFMLTPNGISVFSYPSSIVSVIANNQFTINVLNSAGNVIFSFIGCTCNSYAANVPANAVVTENITFLAMDIVDQTGQSVLNGSFALNSTTALATGIIAGVTGA